MLSSTQPQLPRLFAALIPATTLSMTVVFSLDFYWSSPVYFVIRIISLALTVFVLAIEFVSNAIPASPSYTFVRDALVCRALCVLSSANVTIDVLEGYALVPLPIYILDSVFLFLVTLPFTFKLFLRPAADESRWRNGDVGARSLLVALDDEEKNATLSTDHTCLLPQSDCEGSQTDTEAIYIDMVDDLALVKLRGGSPVEVGSPLVVHVTVEVCEGYI